MKDFYCPYCDHGMDREDINSQVHEDDHIGEWDIECNGCKKPLNCKLKQTSIIGWTLKIGLNHD